MQTNWKLEPLLKFSDSDKHLHPLPHAKDLSTPNPESLLEQ